MVKLKLKAFTLMETLVAGIIISIISGLAMMTYLNIAHTIDSTEDLLVSKKMTSTFDSLSNITGVFETRYLWDNTYQVIGSKTEYDDSKDLYQLMVEIQDTTGNLMSRRRKLIYEPQ